LERHGVSVIPWDRRQIPTDQPALADDFIGHHQPDWFVHLATGDPAWAQSVAGVCRTRGVRFLFTSSVSVFNGGVSGPFSLEHPTDATDDYGRYKAECEHRVRGAHPDALIVRLGWQIGHSAGSNNMVDFLCQTMAEKGQIEASERWLPSCSFLEDTAAALHSLMLEHPPGLYQLEGNPGLSFHTIVTNLNRLGGHNWTVVPVDHPDRDIRMLDDRVKVAPISARLNVDS
jgi:dTDP-4-dehydrorhamnose reductase